ncbi:MAG: hypothetical protein L0212_02675 [Acidobacteria bacterium]|nr:hypothetical protein [Acidobacteriota bacterium]
MSSPMPAPFIPSEVEGCRHRRTRLIAQDDATTYVECLECGELFEAAELDQPPKPQTEFDEDLSDA